MHVVLSDLISFAIVLFLFLIMPLYSLKLIYCGAKKIDKCNLATGCFLIYLGIALFRISINIPFIIEKILS